MDLGPIFTESKLDVSADLSSRHPCIPNEFLHNPGLNPAFRYYMYYLCYISGEF